MSLETRVIIVKCQKSILDLALLQVSEILMVPIDVLVPECVDTPA